MALNAAICVLNSKYIHSSLSPWCLLAGVKQYCDDNIAATVIEGTINQKDSEFISKIVEIKPKVIALSCYIWNITMVRRIIPQLKLLLPGCIIVLGGPEVSYNAKDVLLQNDIDFVISGEGEQPFALLLNAINKGIACQGISGVCNKIGDEIYISEPHTPSGEPPSPYTKEFFDALNGRIAYLETSRGCPYTCAFCLSGRCGTVRFFDIEQAKKNMLLLANSGTQTVKLVDRTFNANKARAKELWRFVIENYGTEIQKGVCFHFEIAGDILDDESLELLSKAPLGCMQLEIGLQSFNPITLNAINRKTNVELLQNNIKRLLEKQNIHTHIDLIAGLPYEDLSSFKSSFNIAYNLKPHMLQLGFLKLLHGAALRDCAKEHGCCFDNQPPYEITSGKWLNEAELCLLHKTEDALERLYNSGRFKRTMEYVMQSSELSPFDLYTRFGGYVSEKANVERIALDDYTALAFEWFSALPQIDESLLRDAMVCDRLATINTGKLPQCLKMKDDLLKRAVYILSSNKKYKAQSGIKRGVAVLYGSNKIVYADYIDKNSITGEYKLNFVPIEALLEGDSQ